MRSAVKSVPRIVTVGEPTTFEQVLDQYLDPLYATARHLCATTADAEDLVQETCLRAYRSFAQLRSTQKAKAWLFSILFNQAIDAARTRRRRPQVADMPLEEALRVHAANPEREPSVETALAVREAMAMLDPEFRVVVWLADGEGFTTIEIARLLGLPQGTVASRLFRGRRRLRLLLGQR